MSYLRLTILALLVAPAVARAADGRVDLYLQPIPPAAATLTFAIASVSAISGSGSEYPLTVRLRTVSQATAGRQRLLASGRIPLGDYAGFRFTIVGAAPVSGRADAALVVPDVPVRLDVPFALVAQQAPLFWLTLTYQPSHPDESGVSPVFTAFLPPRPIADHAGLVTNAGSNTITVFEKTLHQAAAIIETCARPSGMALDQHRRRAYVACARDDEIQSIDVAAADVVDRTRLFPGDAPRELALTPDGATLISVNTGSNSVAFFDATSLARQERLAVGSGPGSVLIDPAGRRAFVFNTLASSISVVDVNARSVVATISTESAPLRGQFNARGDRLYVVHERSPFMTVVDPRQLAIVTRARVRSGVRAIAVDGIRNLVYVGGPDDRTIEFYDPNALVPVNAMKTRAGTSYLTIDAEDNTLYMVSPDTNSVVAGSLADRTITAEIDVGEDPVWVAVMGER